MNTNWKSRAASVAVCGMPLINYCYVFCFWLLASATLGHWAQPNVNDPKRFLFGLPEIVGIILMLMSFAVAPSRREPLVPKANGCSARVAQFRSGSLVRKPSRTFVIEDPDPKAIRERLGLSQSRFASIIGVSVRTLQNWEQGRREPYSE